MAEITALCAAAVIMAAMYTGTAHPRLYAFFNSAAGALSLAASQVYFHGGTSGITAYNAALSVILGVPGTVLHRLIEMM